MNYSESEIQEALNELVASGEIVQEGDGYYVPEENKRFHPTTEEQGWAVEALMSAFDLGPGDFAALTFFDSGVEVRTSQVQNRSASEFALQ